MARLTKGARKALPKKDFAGPGRSFPIENRAHARAAIMDAGIDAKKGRITTAEKKRIDKKAAGELRKGDKTKQPTKKRR